MVKHRRKQFWCHPATFITKSNTGCWRSNYNIVRIPTSGKNINRRKKLTNGIYNAYECDELATFCWSYLWNLILATRWYNFYSLHDLYHRYHLDYKFSMEENEISPKWIYNLKKMVNFMFIKTRASAQTCTLGFSKRQSSVPCHKTS